MQTTVAMTRYAALKRALRTERYMETQRRDVENLYSRRTYPFLSVLLV